MTANLTAERAIIARHPREAREIAVRLMDEPPLVTLLNAPHDGVRQLAAVLLVGLVCDELSKTREERARPPGRRCCSACGEPGHYASTCSAIKAMASDPSAPSERA